jgi:predicted ATP-grasp superfamily ATP-dependent carboligase
MQCASVSGASSRPAVLLTDADARGVLAAARTLASAGFRVGAAAQVRRAATHWSRAAAGRHLTPDPRADPEAFVEALARIASISAYSALIAGSDAALRAISDFRARLPPRLRVGLPPAPVVATALDKRCLTDLAREMGMPQPRSEACETLEGAITAAELMGYPVVLKPQSTVFLDGETLHQRSSRIVSDGSDLVGMAPHYGSPFLVQEYLRGATYSLAGVVADGALPAVAMARYDRTWPPAAGNAAFATTVEPPAAVLSAARRFLGRLEWRGLFELEYIARSDGSFVLIDLNPRPYGSLALASAAGAPLAVVWTRVLFGERPNPVVARAGHRYRWEDGDLRNLLCTIRGGDRGRALRAARPRRRTVHAYFHWTDPAPLAARALELSSRALRRHDRGARSAPRRPSKRSSPPEPPRRVPA